MRLQIIALFLILLVPFVYSTTEYKYPNYDNGVGGSSLFNDDIEVNFYSTSIADPYQIPYVADIDNDGTTEIIVINGNILSIYDSISLDFEGSFYYADSGKTFSSNLVIQDIDNDDYQEIIGVTDKNITIIQWNGTNMQFDANFNSGNSSIYDSQIGCDETTNLCLIDQSTNAGQIHYIGAFNSSFLTYSIVINGVASSDLYCDPYIKYVEVADYDQDGENEFILSHYLIDVGGGSNEKSYVRYYSISGETVSLDQTSTTTFIDWASVGTCSSITGVTYAGHFISAPLTIDFDYSSPGLETIIGVVRDGRDGQETFQIYAYKSDSTLLDEFPDATLSKYGRGQIISNIINLNSFAYSTRSQDVCVQGVRSLVNEFDLLCASKEGSIGLYEHIIFNEEMVYTPSDWESNQWLNIIHSIKSVQTHGRDQFLNAFGVYDLYLPGDLFSSDCELLSDCSLDFLVTPGVSDALNLPIDYEDVGRADILVLSDSTLWYFDDQIGNQHCDTEDCIVFIETNPSIDNIIKINTTFRIRTRLNDSENDPMQLRITLYDDHSNEQSTGWVNVSSGQIYSTTALKVNQTITAGILTFEARDTDDITKIQTLEFDFTVALQGDVFGDSVYTYEVEEEEAEAEIGDSYTPCETNSDCDSGLCEYHICVLKTANMECISDSECLSGDCLSGFCTKADIWSKIEASKNQQFGDTSDSNNFVALFLIIGIPLVIIIAGLGSIASIIVAGFTFIGLAVFFTIVGWLSPFILLGIFIICLLVIVLAVMIKGGS